MGSNYRSRVLYLLLPEERNAPEILLQAAAIRCLRRGSEPDMSIKQFDPSVVVISGPLDHDGHIALDRVSTLMLPVLGYGTGPNDRLMCDASLTISLSDLRSMLSLLASPSVLCSLPTGQGANGMGTWLKHSADSFAQMMEHLLSLRMPDYRDRGERVVQACLWIGSHLGMGGEELNTLQLAARMREIGKLGLPDKILFASRDQRSADEQSMYDRYPMLGARVLQQFPVFISAARIVENHLENFDGSGAMHLIAQQIPLGSRILRVASAFQMISDTGDQGREQVVRTLGRGRGSLYDPMLVGLVENYATLVTSPLKLGVATRRVRLSDLLEGMVLAEDIWSRTGVKIVGAGTRLNEHIIRILMTLPLNMAIESVEVQREEQ